MVIHLEEEYIKIIDSFMKFFDLIRSFWFTAGNECMSESTEKNATYKTEIISLIWKKSYDYVLQRSLSCWSSLHLHFMPQNAKAIMVFTRNFAIPFDNKLRKRTPQFSYILSINSFNSIVQIIHKVLEKF